MHDINYFHEHELKEHDFLGCCKDCRASLNIIKPHILAFAERIRKYTRKMLEDLSQDELYRLYQILAALTGSGRSAWTDRLESLNCLKG